MIKKVLISTLSIVVVVNMITAADELSNIYTICSPAYEEILTSLFLPSIQDHLNVKIKRVKDEFPPKGGWASIAKNKVALIIEAIKENWGKVFIYSDVDVVFLKPIKESLLKKMANIDIICQSCWPRWWRPSSNFLVIRASPTTLQVWERIEKICRTSNCNEQDALTEVLEANNSIKWIRLPHQLFINGVKLIGRRLYRPNLSLMPLPQEAILIHADWCVGADNKKNFLQEVLKFYAANQIKS